MSTAQHQDTPANEASQLSSTPISRRLFLALPLVAIPLAACADEGDELGAALDEVEAELEPVVDEALDAADQEVEAALDSTLVEDSQAEPVAETQPVLEGETATAALATWRMPAEDLPHARTWMCWPSSDEVWAEDLPAVQDAIAEIALSIAEFEPVSMLARPSEVAAVKQILGSKITVVSGPVDDLWARDTLPNFLTRDVDGKVELAAGRVTFNGWGGKQIHSGDQKLAGLVAETLNVPLIDSGIVGEGGGIEVDGHGSVLAAASSWVNNNRNPGKSKAEIEQGLLALLGADRMIWVDGLAGADITDGHIDTLARFANETTIVIDKPAFDDPNDPWVKVAERTKEQVQAARTKSGEPYNVVEIVQPSTVRQQTEGFLSTYMNYYVCNGAVIAPQFGDKKADAAAKKVLSELFPDREIVQINIDALSAGGGGIHCATQQQPASIVESPKS